MKRLFIVLGLLLFTITYAQFGINTSNVLGVFHVDGERNNPLFGTVSTAQQTDDFIVTPSGHVGIGKTNPQRKLDIDANNESVIIRNLLRQVPANHNILIRDEISGDITSAKYSYTINSGSIPAGSSMVVTIPFTIDIPSGILTIRANNACGRTMISTYIYSNLSLGYISSVARDKVGIVTASVGTGSSINWGIKFTNVVGCADGGNGTQFDYTIVKNNSNTYMITNNGNIAKNYIITLLRL